MRFLRPALAIFSALLAFTTAFTAWAREPSPEEIGELEALIDDGNLEAAAELRAGFFFDDIDSPAVDAQTMRLQYYKQDYDAAFSIAEKLLAANPRHAMALNTRGLVKSQRGDSAGALADFDAAIAADAGYGKAHFNRAGLLCAQQQYAAADASYVAAIETIPDKGGVYQARISCLITAEQATAAIGVATDWYQWFPNWDALRYRSEARRIAGDRDGAYADRLRSYAMYGSRNDENSVVARNMLDEGEADMALELLNAQIAKHPDNQYLYLERGEILDALYRDHEALADFNRAFTKVDNVTQPMRSRSMALRGFIKLKRGDKAGATADFDRAIAYDATDPVGWFGRGSVALEARDYDAAIAAIGKAVEILPGNVLYSTMLGAAQKKGR